MSIELTDEQYEEIFEEMRELQKKVDELNDYLAEIYPEHYVSSKTAQSPIWVSKGYCNLKIKRKTQGCRQTCVHVSDWN